MQDHHNTSTDEHHNEELGLYISGGYGTYNKKPLRMNEMLQLP